MVYLIIFLVLLTCVIGLGIANIIVKKRLRKAFEEEEKEE